MVSQVGPLIAKAKIKKSSENQRFSKLFFLVHHGKRYRIVSEQNVYAIPMYVSPFVLRHHLSVLAERKYPAHGLTVWVCHRSSILSFLSVVTIFCAFRVVRGIAV